MLFVLTLSTTYYYKYLLLITRVHVKGNNVLRPSQLLDFSDAHPQTMPTTVVFLTEGVISKTDP